MAFVMVPAYTCWARPISASSTTATHSLSSPKTKRIRDGAIAGAAFKVGGSVFCYGCGSAVKNKANVSKINEASETYLFSVAFAKVRTFHIGHDLHRRELDVPGSDCRKRTYF
jgi:hypothetical protein